MSTSYSDQYRFCLDFGDNCYAAYASLVETGSPENFLESNLRGQTVHFAKCKDGPFVLFLFFIFL